MSGKSAWRNSVIDDPRMQECVVDGVSHRVRVRPFAVCVDWLTRLLGFDAEQKRSCDLLERCRQSAMEKLNADSVETLVWMVDKREFVPMTKGVTQQKRRESFTGLSKKAKIGQLDEERRQRTLDRASDLSTLLPPGMSVDEAVDRGLITEDMVRESERMRQAAQDRFVPFGRKYTDGRATHLQKKHEIQEQLQSAASRLSVLDADLPHNALRIRDVQVEGMNVLERALLTCANELLPTPWRIICGGQNREILMRYITRGMLFDRHQHLDVPRGKQFILDGHCCSRDHLRVDDETRLAAPFRSLQDECTPLVFYNQADVPEDVLAGPDVARSTHDVDARDMQQEAPLEYGVQHRPYAVAHWDRRLHNTIGESDYTLFFYVLKLLEPRDPSQNNVVELVSVDTDIFLNGLWFLYKWRQNMLSQDVAGREMPQLFLTHGASWMKPHAGAGSVDLTMCYKRMVEYYLDGDEHRMPSLLACVCCCTGDYTLGYHNVPVKQFVEAFDQYATLDRGAQGQAPYLSRLAEYVETRADQHVPSTTAVTQHVLEQDASTGARTWIARPMHLRMSGVVYRRLVKCAYAVKHAGVLKKAKIDDVTQVTLARVRQLVNDHVTKGQYRGYVQDPQLLPFDATEFEKLMASLKKRLPPDQEMGYRAGATLNQVIMVSQVGAARIDDSDLAALVFEPADSARPISSVNIQHRCREDYEGREELWRRKVLDLE